MHGWWYFRGKRATDDFFSISYFFLLIFSVTKWTCDLWMGSRGINLLKFSSVFSSHHPAFIHEVPAPHFSEIQIGYELTYHQDISLKSTGSSDRFTIIQEVVIWFVWKAWGLGGFNHFSCCSQALISLQYSYNIMWLKNQHYFRAFCWHIIIISMNLIITHISVVSINHARQEQLKYAKTTMI